MEKKFSAVEKQQVSEQFEKKQKRLYLQGKIITYIIAIIHIIGAVVSIFTDFNFIALIVQIALSIALLCGASWARYLFAIGAGLASLLSIYFLVVLIDFSVQPGLATYFVLTLIYSAVSCVVLFVSKSVSEFLYARKNG